MKDIEFLAGMHIAYVFIQVSNLDCRWLNLKKILSIIFFIRKSRHFWCYVLPSGFQLSVPCQPRQWLSCEYGIWYMEKEAKVLVQASEVDFPK